MKSCVYSRAAFRFMPLSHSWVALHPHPCGVIQFIGGAFFGTWPTFFYRYLLRYFYEQGYTIVALPFRFSFQHWAISATLYAEQQALRPLMIAEAQARGFDVEVYHQRSCYFWLGHSMGCKYVALLEILSDPDWKNKLSQTLDEKQAKAVIGQIDVTHLAPMITDQPSVLIAPDISDTESAVPIKAVARLLDRLNLGVSPDRQQTQRLMERSRVFNLTALVSLESDRIAGSLALAQKAPTEQEDNDVAWLLNFLQSRAISLLHKEFLGKHLEPLGFTWRQFTWNPFGRTRRDLSQRPIESTVERFIEKLKVRVSVKISTE